MGCPFALFPISPETLATSNSGDLSKNRGTARMQRTVSFSTKWEVEAKNVRWDFFA
jgi:hypothetical protein